MDELEPWILFSKHRSVGDRFSGYISRIDGEIGLFISLDGEIDGIVHLADLDWVILSEDAIQRYQVGVLVEPKPPYNSNVGAATRTGGPSSSLSNRIDLV